jgi:hypothetical protein
MSGVFRRPWRPPPRRAWVPSKAATGGTTFTITPSGSTTPAGNLSKQASKPLAGSAATVGTIAKKPAKALAGAVTPTGALVKLVSKALAGAVTPTGALVKLVARRWPAQ